MISEGKKPLFRWKWSRESPIEIVLVVFIIVGFFAFPRAGCGVTQTDAPAATAQ